MAVILCIESSSEICSIAVARDNEVLSMIETKEPFSHTRKTTSFIRSCLEEASVSIDEVNAVAISDGPGSYTGLRVGAATAKGLCFGLDIPLIAVNTLEAIANYANQKLEGDIIIPMIDARRMEVYTTIYNNVLEEVEAMQNLILTETSFRKYEDGSIVLCGTGVNKCSDLFVGAPYHLLPFDLSAGLLVSIAFRKFREKSFENIVSYSPNYFKSPKVTKSKKPLF